MRAPTSTVGAILWLLLYTAWLRLVGLRFEERASRDVPARARARLDALEVASVGLAAADNVFAACMQAQHLVQAMRAGERSYVRRAAVIYEIHLAGRGGSPDEHEKAVIDLVDRLADASETPEDRAARRAVRGVSAYLRGRWREALEALDTCYAELPNVIAGWQAQSALLAVNALLFMGELTEMRRRCTRMLADAEERGDLAASVQLRAGYATVLWLAADDAEGARRQTREAAAQWTHENFLVPQWQVMHSEVDIELYGGGGDRAYARLERDARALSKSLLLHVQVLRALTTFARGRAAIASIEQVPSRRVARIGEARRLARRLEREHMPWTAPLAAIVNASAENAGGDRASAAGLLRSAIELADAAGMPLYAAAAQYQLGVSIGPSAGDELVERAISIMTAREIRVPSRVASMLVPGRWD